MGARGCGVWSAHYKGARVPFPLMAIPTCAGFGVALHQNRRDTNNGMNGVLLSANTNEGTNENLFTLNCMDTLIAYAKCFHLRKQKFFAT